MAALSLNCLFKGYIYKYDPVSEVLASGLSVGMWEEG